MKKFPLENKNYNDLQKQLIRFPQSDFACIRKNDIHTGIDIYCDEFEDVRAMEKGVVVNMDIFTGPKVGSPWWNETQSIVIQSLSGYILYGEIIINPNLKLGDLVETGDHLGNVITVLKKDKGTNPINMLHLELYKSGPFAVVWNLNKTQPENLLNPQVLF